MLVYPRTYDDKFGISAAVLYPERGVRIVKGELALSQGRKPTLGETALALARDFWDADEGDDYRIHGGARLKGVEDVCYVSTRVLNNGRIATQGTDEFVFPVGEEVLLMQENAELLWKNLPGYGVSARSVRMLQDMLNPRKNKGGLAKEGYLPCHVVNFASRRSKNPYLDLDNSCALNSICRGVAHGSVHYYEFVSAGSRNYPATHILMPVGLAETVATLRPDPTPLAFWSLFRESGML
jgi:hypothetical protein